MPFVLVRVDDRMIHGQVVVGWGNAIHPDRIILCHDEISASQWEKDLYESSFSGYDCVIRVLSTSELLDYCKTELFTKERTILITETPKDVLLIYESGIHFDKLNIGGLHFKESKKELNNYIYVDSEDVKCITKLKEYGVFINGQDVPNAKKVNIEELIKKKAIAF